MTIPDTIISDLTASVASIMNGVSPLVVILFGVCLSFLFVKGVMGLLPKI